jgi:hypothetical protein
MQVFGLAGHLIRSDGTLAAGDRGRAHQRGRANAVGVPRATLYRWEQQPQRRSSQPHHIRSKNWPSALVRAVERLRQDFPMWGDDGKQPADQRISAGPFPPNEDAGARGPRDSLKPVLTFLPWRTKMVPLPPRRRKLSALALL